MNGVLYNQKHRSKMNQIGYRRAKDCLPGIWEQMPPANPPSTLMVRLTALLENKFSRAVGDRGQRPFPPAISTTLI
jgi:hypothetical protein